MAEIDLIKISELPATSTIGDADELAVVQGGATKKVPYSALKAGAEVTPDTTLSEAGVPADAAAVGAALALKANQAAVTQALDAKADKTEVTGISGDIAELASVVETKADQTALNQKADKTTTDALRQDLTTLNGIVSQKADKTELNTQIGNVTAELATKANTADVNNRLAAKADIASPVFTGRPQAPTAPKGTATLQLATTAFVQNAIDDKQDTLTFDAAPTQGSTNPVTSGGVYTALEDAKDDAEEATAEAREIALKAFATPTASGQLITLTDGANGIPAKKLTLNLVPHQEGSGDPSPDNVRPISGYTDVTVTRAGKNIVLLNFTSFVNAGITYTRNADGSVTAVGTSTSGVAGKDMSYLYLPNGNYIINGGSAAIGVRVNLYNAEDVVLSRITSRGEDKPFVINDTVDHVGFACGYVTTDTAVNETIYPMIRSADFTDATFEPYTADTYPIALPTAAGTVYGGSLEINEDGTGTLTVDMAAVDLGTLTWSRIVTSGDHWRFYVNKNDMASNATIIADRYVQVSPTAQYTGVQGIAMQIGGSNAILLVSDEAYSTADEFKAAMDGAIAVYTIAAPTTYILTADQVTTLLGDNTLWMDADGTIDLTYRADTEKYVERRIAEVQALALENNG